MTPRVLILDDEEGVGRALSRQLKQAGFEPVYETDSQGALQRLRSEDIAVVISDQYMPACSGIEFLERCAREFPLAVQILLTGYPEAQVAVDAINRTEVVRFLQKPWGQEEMVSAVREAAWAHELRKQ